MPDNASNPSNPSIPLTFDIGENSSKKLEIMRKAGVFRKKTTFMRKLLIDYIVYQNDKKKQKTKISDTKKNRRKI